MDSSSSTRIATHMPRGKVPNLNLKPTSRSEQGNDGKPPLSNVHYHSPRGTPLTPQTVLEDTATKAADERHVSVFEDSDQVFITINNCVRPIKEYLALEGSFFSTKYENGSQEFKDKVHRLIHLTEDFLRSFADKPQAANKTRLRELAFELAQILDLRDAEGWTQQTVEGARTAARHYTKPARDTNNLIAAVSAGSSIGIAGTALLGMPVVTGAAALALGVTTPFVFAYATLWQTKCHPTGLAGVAQQGPIFMPTVAPRNVIDWQGNSTPLRVSPDIKRDMALIEALLRSFEGAKATTRVINNKLRALNGEIKSIQEELAKKLLVADRAEFEDAIEKHKTEAVNALMFMSSKRGQRPDLYLKLLRLKKDREFCRSLLSDASWVRPPDGQHGTLHVGKKFLAKQNAQALTVGDPSHATKERLKAKLGSLRLDLLRSNLYLALNVQKQSDGRALRGGFNFGTAIFNLASAAAAYYDHLSPDDLPQNRVLGLHPSTLNLAGAAMTLTQAAVFNWTQPKLGTDDQLTRLSAMLQIKLLERGLRKNPFNPDLDNLLDALDERNPFDPKRLDAIAQGWGKVRCTHIGRILDFDRDCYILAIITHMLPPMKEETPSWTKPFKLTPGGEDTRIPATAEDFLVVLRKCKSDYREALIQQISPWALKKARNKIKRLLAVIQGLEKMAAEVKAMNVERMLLNGKIVVNEDKDQRLALLQPAARDIFEQSLLCARNKFLLTKGKQTHIEQPGGWTLSQLEEGDLALIQMRGMVDALTDGTAEPEFAQKAGQHHSYILFGAYSPQLIKALGFIFSGIAQMLSWEQAARIISMASSSTAMLSALLNFGLVYAYHKHIALKFAQQNRNQALGTVDVPNTGPWPFKSQFETLAAVPVREADLGSGDLNLQSDLSFFQDYLAQMQAAPIGGFKGRDGSWQLPFRNWMGYFSKKPEDLDELNPQEVETDLAKAFQEVLLEVKNIEEMEKKKLANIKRDAKHEHSDSDDGHHLIEVDEAVGDDSHDSGHSEDSTAQDTNAEAFDNFFDYNKKSTSSSSDNEGGHESHGGSYVDESNDDSSGSDDERRKNVAMASRFWNLRDEPTPDYVTKMPVDS